MASGKPISGLEKLQTPDGFWRTVLNEPDSYRETSVTAGGVFGVLRGIRPGLVDTRFKPMAERALAALRAKINDQGDVNDGSCGTPIMAGPADYNKVPPALTPFTQGLALMALNESLNE
jgi:unsaturated rhamnogalacturonyl hydrolase